MLSDRCLSCLSVTLVCCGQTVGWIKMPLGRKVDLGPGDIVLDGDPALPKGAQQPHFWAHVYCGQTVRWIKKPLGTQVGVGPGDIVLEHPAPPSPRGGGVHSTPHTFLLWLKGWIDQDATWYGGRARPRPHYVRWEPSSPKERSSSLTFRSISIVTKRLDG